METEKLIRHLACWNYYQSIDTSENKAFVEAFKKYCASHKLPGGMDRVTDDPIEAAYYGIYVWKAAVEKAGTFDIDKVRDAVYGLKFDAPGGPKQMDESNQHVYKPVYIGEIKSNGQFKIVKAMQGLVKPESYSKYLHPDGKFPEPKRGQKPGQKQPS